MYPINPNPFGRSGPGYESKFLVSLNLLTCLLIKIMFSEHVQICSLDFTNNLIMFTKRAGCLVKLANNFTGFHQSDEIFCPAQTASVIGFCIYCSVIVVIVI